MKVRVITEFVDKHTGELHKVGSSFECKDTRFKEILEAGTYVEPVKEENKEKPSKKA